MPGIRGGNAGLAPLCLMIAGLAMTGCVTSESGADIRVRVVNERPAAISVVIGPAKYGSILPGDTTPYRRVREGDNEVWVDGELSEDSPAHFATGTVDCRWTYVFTIGGSGYGIDRCD